MISVILNICFITPFYLETPLSQIFSARYNLHSFSVRYTLHIHRRMGMNLKEQIEEIKEFIVNFSIDINTDDGLAVQIESSINQAHASDSLTSILGIGIPYMGMLLPIIIVFIVFYFSAKENKDKYDAMIEVSKNVEDPAVVEDLLASFKENKKSPRDYRKDGVTTAFTGVGLFLFGTFFLGDILMGVGALVFTIGVGLLVAGYLYPRESDEINKAVEDFEKR